MWGTHPAAHAILARFESALSEKGYAPRTVQEQFMGKRLLGAWNAHKELARLLKQSQPDADAKGIAVLAIHWDTGNPENLAVSVCLDDLATNRHGHYNLRFTRETDCRGGWGQATSCSYTESPDAFGTRVGEAVARSLPTLAGAPGAAANAEVPGKLIAVHVYRSAWEFMPGKPSLFVDGIQVARLRSGRQFTLGLKAGKRHFAIEKADGFAIDVMLAEGEEYYLNSYAGGSSVERIQMVEPVEGIKAASKMRVLEDEWIMAPEAIIRPH
jgi:hypothetical protein